MPGRECRSVGGRVGIWVHVEILHIPGHETIGKALATDILDSENTLRIACYFNLYFAAQTSSDEYLHMLLTQSTTYFCSVVKSYGKENEI